MLAKKGSQAQDLLIKESLDREQVIRSLENRLKQQNRGQGLGFKLSGTVIDKALLGSLAVKLATAGSTALAYLLKLADDDAAAACVLTESEVTALQALQDAMRFSNSTCDRFTLGEVLAM